MSDVKLTMVKIIADVSLDNIVDYNSLLNHICNCRYRLIDKVPIDIYFIGIVTRFIIKDITHANQLLDVLKEVTQEALEKNVLLQIKIGMIYLLLNIIVNNTRLIATIYQQIKKTKLGIKQKVICMNFLITNK